MRKHALQQNLTSASNWIVLFVLCTLSTLNKTTLSYASLDQITLWLNPICIDQIQYNTTPVKPNNFGTFTFFQIIVKIFFPWHTCLLDLNTNTLHVRYCSYLPCKHVPAVRQQYMNVFNLLTSRLNYKTNLYACVQIWIRNKLITKINFNLASTAPMFVDYSVRIMVKSAG